MDKLTHTKITSANKYIQNSDNLLQHLVRVSCTWRSWCYRRWDYYEVRRLLLFAVWSTICVHDDIFGWIGRY